MTYYTMNSNEAGMNESNPTFHIQPARGWCPSYVVHRSRLASTAVPKPSLICHIRNDGVSNSCTDFSGCRLVLCNSFRLCRSPSSRTERFYRKTLRRSVQCHRRHYNPRRRRHQNEIRMHRWDTRTISF